MVDVEAGSGMKLRSWEETRDRSNDGMPRGGQVRVLIAQTKRWWSKLQRKVPHWQKTLG